jgi:hypothetical protein
MIECLEGLAGVATDQGQATHALQLMGAAHTAREAAHTPLIPAEREALDRLEAAARAHLGETEAATAWQAGREMSLDEMVGEALTDDPEPAPDGTA